MTTTNSLLASITSSAGSIANGINSPVAAPGAASASNPITSASGDFTRAMLNIDNSMPLTTSDLVVGNALYNLVNNNATTAFNQAKATGQDPDEAVTLSVKSSMGAMYSQQPQLFTTTSSVQTQIDNLIAGQSASALLSTNGLTSSGVLTSSLSGVNNTQGSIQAQINNLLLGNGSSVSGLPTSTISSLTKQISSMQTGLMGQMTTQMGPTIESNLSSFTNIEKTVSLPAEAELSGMISGFGSSQLSGLTDQLGSITGQPSGALSSLGNISF